MLALLMFQEPVPTPSPSLEDTVAASITALVPILIPVLVPILVSMFRKWEQYIPRWTFPIIATTLGVALQQIDAYVQAVPHNIVLGALLGLTGIGLREFYDQVFAKTVLPRLRRSN